MTRPKLPTDGVAWDYNGAIEHGRPQDDIYWAFQMISRCRTQSDAFRIAQTAPTPGAASLLYWACDPKHKDKFFTVILPKAMTHKEKEGQFRDDGRKFLEIFGPIHDRILANVKAEPQCPTCGRAITKHVTLFRRPKGDGKAPDLEEGDAGCGSGEP